MLSIVTICRNNLAGLRDTLTSLDAQTDRDFELRVVDGASVDGTPGFLASRTKSRRFSYTSEPDRGVFDAMNKGVHACTGSHVWFLNAGDTCVDPRVVGRIRQALAADDTVDVLYGRVWFVSAYGRRSVGTPVTSRSFRASMPLCHQGIIYRREVLLGHPYPTEYHLISDWIVTRQLFETGARSRFLDAHLACYNLDGASSRQHAALVREMLRYERTLAAKVRVLLQTGGRYAALWLAHHTGLYGLYKRWQHLRCS